MRRFLAVAAGAVLASGCLLTTSLDDLMKGSTASSADSGGATDSGAGGTDGTTPPSDAPSGADVTASDAPTDTGTDTGPTTTFCTGKTTTFCEDFDREPFDSAWSTQINPGGGCFAERRTAMSPFSAPKGLLASCKSTASGTTMGQAIIRRFPGQLGSAITVSCMVRVDEIQSGQYSNGMSVIIRGNGKEVYTQLGYELAGPTMIRLYAEKYGGDDGTGVVGTMPKGDWRRISLRVVAPDATHGHLIVTQGTQSVALDIAAGIWPPVGSRGLEVALGVYYTETPGTTIAYDDCTIDKEN